MRKDAEGDFKYALLDVRIAGDLDDVGELVDEVSNDRIQLVHQVGERVVLEEVQTAVKHIEVEAPVGRVHQVLDAVAEKVL